MQKRHKLFLIIARCDVIVIGTGRGALQNRAACRRGRESRAGRLRIIMIVKLSGDVTVELEPRDQGRVKIMICHSGGTVTVTVTAATY